MSQILFFAYIFRLCHSADQQRFWSCRPMALQKKAHVCGKVRGENLGWDILRFQALNQHLDLTNKHVFFSNTTKLVLDHLDLQISKLAKSTKQSLHKHGPQFP